MQSLGCFIDFVSKHSVTRPIQNSRELVVSHSASLAELPLYGNPLSYWASTNSCSEPLKLRTENELSCPQGGDRVPIVLTRGRRRRMPRRRRGRGGGILRAGNPARRCGRREGRPKGAWGHGRRSRSFPNGGRATPHPSRRK